VQCNALVGSIPFSPRVPTLAARDSRPRRSRRLACQVRAQVLQLIEEQGFVFEAAQVEVKNAVMNTPYDRDRQGSEFPRQVLYSGSTGRDTGRKWYAADLCVALHLPAR